MNGAWGKLKKKKTGTDRWNMSDALTVRAAVHGALLMASCE